MRTLFNIPYDCKRTSPAFEIMLVCMLLTAIALWWY